MKRKMIRSKFVGGLVTAAIMTSVCAAAMPCSAAENETSVNFDDGIALPWHAVASAPAQLNVDISEGTYNITIVNCGGEANGGQSRWDCQFVHRGLNFHAGDSYTVKAEVSTDQTGEIYTKIGNLAGDIELWHNGYGEANPSYGVGWNCIKLKAGQTLKIDSTWTCPRDLDVAEWAWQFGGAGPHQIKDCFPAGTVLKFDNLSIVDNTRELNDSNRLLTWDGWTKNDCADIYSKDGSPAAAVNHYGYFTNGSKKATLHAKEAFEKQQIRLINADTLSAVFQQTVSADKVDADSNQYTAEIDFTAVKTPGKYFFTLDGVQISPEFVIGDDIYDALLSDSLGYFSKIRSDERSAYIQSEWRKNGAELDMDKELTIQSGWYDSTNSSMNTIDGAYSAWMLQNLYEWSSKHESAKFADGSDVFANSENENSVPDLLDEARQEIEFLLEMMVPEGENGENMVYHEISSVRANAADGGTVSVPIVQPTSTAATLNVAAVAAQASRLWKEYDEDFSALCLEKAESAFSAAVENQKEYAPSTTQYGTDLSEDSILDDEFYWAASELYITTSNDKYLDEMSAYNADTISFCGTDEYYVMTPNKTSAQAAFSLLLNGKATEDVQKQLKDIADALLKTESEQGFGLPYQAEPSLSADLQISSYAKQSNGMVAANAILLAYAYDLTEDTSYLNGALQGLDYLLGRNVLGFSYVTGEDERSVKNPIIRSNFESVPNGVMVGGPTGYDMTDYLMNAGFSLSDLMNCAPQSFYADDSESYSTNEVSTALNAPLAWLVSFLDDNGATEAEAQTPSEEIILPGDADNDGKVDISDAILVYRIAAEDTEITISAEGKKRADSDGDGKLTAADAVQILKIIALLV